MGMGIKEYYVCNSIGLLRRLTRAGPILWLAFVDRVVQTPKPKPFIAFAQQRAADDAYMPERLRLRHSASGGDRASARYCRLLWGPNLSFRLRSPQCRTWNGLSGSWAGAAGQSSL